MFSNSPDRTPNPRMVLAILAVIMAAQGVYAALAIFSDSAVATGPLQLVLGAAFVIYAAMIVAFAFGIWRRMSWAWPRGGSGPGPATMPSTCRKSPPAP